MGHIKWYEIRSHDTILFLNAKQFLWHNCVLPFHPVTDFLITLRMVIWDIGNYVAYGSIPFVSKLYYQFSQCEAIGMVIFFPSNIFAIFPRKNYPSMKVFAFFHMRDQFHAARYRSTPIKMTISRKGSMGWLSRVLYYYVSITEIRNLNQAISWKLSVLKLLNVFKNTKLQVHWGVYIIKIRFILLHKNRQKHLK